MREVISGEAVGKQAVNVLENRELYSAEGDHHSKISISREGGKIEADEPERPVLEKFYKKNLKNTNTNYNH